MNTKYLIAKHQALVTQRKQLVSKYNEKGFMEDTEIKEIESLDRQIGKLAAVFNPRISKKAAAYLETQ